MTHLFSSSECASAHICTTPQRSLRVSLIFLSAPVSPKAVSNFQSGLATFARVSAHTILPSKFGSGLDTVLLRSAAMIAMKRRSRVICVAMGLMSCPKSCVWMIERVGSSASGSSFLTALASVFATPNRKAPEPTLGSKTDNLRSFRVKFPTCELVSGGSSVSASLNSCRITFVSNGGGERP